MTTTAILYVFLIVTNILIFPLLLKTDLLWQNYYLLLLLNLMNGYFLIALRKFPPVFSQKMVSTDLLWSLLAAGLPTLLYFSNVHEYSLWLDEYVHCIVADSKDILAGAALSQQPPLGYYWTYLGLLLFGTTELGSRFFSLLSGFLFLWVMFLNIKKLTANNVFSFLGTIFLGLNTWFILYSVEARPYMVSLFYFSVFLYFLIEYFHSAFEKHKLLFALNLMCTGLLWLLSISMQPLIFVSLLLVYSITILIIRRQKSFLLLAFGIAGALILYIPFLQIIVNQSQNFIRTDSFEVGNCFKQVISNFKLLAFFFLNNWYYHSMYFLMLIVVILALSVTKKYKFLLANYFAFFIGYMALVVVLFTLKINWIFSPRYILTIVPLFYLIFIFSLQLIFEKWTARPKNLFLAGLIAIAAFSYNLDKPVKSIKLDWRGLYAQFDIHTKSTAKAYFLLFPNPGSWPDEYFIASEFYPNKKVRVPTWNDYQFPLKMTNDFIFSDFSTDKNIQEFYFVFFKREPRDQQLYDSLNIANSEKFDLNDFYMIKINSPGGALPAAKSFYQQLELLYPESPQKHRVYDGLFLIALFEKNCADLIKYHTKEKLTARAFKPTYKARLKNHAEKLRALCNQ